MGAGLVKIPWPREEGGMTFWVIQYPMTNLAVCRIVQVRDEGDPYFVKTFDDNNRRGVWGKKFLSQLMRSGFVEFL